MKILEYEHINCDFCGSHKYKLLYRKPDTWLWLNQFEFPVVKCINCDLVYVNPRPTTESMRDYYPNNYHDDRDSEDHMKRYAIQSEFLPKLHNEKILDIGCARGDFLNFLKQLYPQIDAYGIDFYSDKVKFDTFNFINAELQNAGFPDNGFDIITAWAVFEHLHSPSMYFSEASRILKKNGHLIFLVTNAESLYGKKAYVEDVPRHLHHFSERSLSNYAHKYGFNVSRITYDDRLWDGRGWGTFYYYLQRLFGADWEKIYFKKINYIQKVAGLIGTLIDKIVFCSHWEAKTRRSGIIIVEFVKN